MILSLEEKSKTIVVKAEFTSGIQTCMEAGVGAVAHLIRVTDFSYQAYSLSRKGSSKHGMRIIEKELADIRCFLFGFCLPGLTSIAYN